MSDVILIIHERNCMISPT